MAKFRVEFWSEDLEVEAETEEEACEKAFAILADEPLREYSKLGQLSVTSSSTTGRVPVRLSWRAAANLAQLFALVGGVRADRLFSDATLIDSCKQCGCTEGNACSTFPACSWTDDTRTLCTNPECLAKEAAQKPQPTTEQVTKEKP